VVLHYLRIDVLVDRLDMLRIQLRPPLLPEVVLSEVFEGPFPLSIMF
jgi:hypothetical protein